MKQRFAADSKFGNFVWYTSKRHDDEEFSN